MNRLNAIDDKIAHLKTLKEDLEMHAGRLLYRKINAILGENFTPQLALVILRETWKNASLETKESWQEKANTFPFRCLSRRASKDSQKTHANSQ
jgi:hypothetical protein